jgi:UDP-N-acetylglucosamine transferase subunit ALG13
MHGHQSRTGVGGLVTNMEAMKSVIVTKLLNINQTEVDDTKTRLQMKLVDEAEVVVNGEVK